MQNNLKIILFSLFGILCLITVGALIFIIGLKETQAPISQSTPTSSILPSSSQIPDETWQTYRNEEYGFEVKYPPRWKSEQEEHGNTLYRFRLYSIEEDARQKDFAQKCTEDPSFFECAESSSGWWTQGIHIMLVDNSQKSDLVAVVDQWNKTNLYSFGRESVNFRLLKVVKGNAWTKLGQDAFLFLNSSKTIQFLVEDIPSHDGLTEQILSSFQFI